MIQRMNGSSQAMQPGPTREFDRTETIFGQGEAALAWYELISGSARLCQYHEDGRRQILGFAYPGDAIGLGGDVYACAAEPLTRVVVRCHDRIGDNMSPNGSGGMTETEILLGRALCSAQESLSLIGRPGATARVAGFLNSVCSRIGVDGEINLPMSRADIADYLGLTAHTVSRTISALARSRLIALDGPGRIYLLDRDGLDALAGADSSDVDDPVSSLLLAPVFGDAR